MRFLEICIDSFKSAKAAVAGGADRLEVCSSLALGGLTPSVGLVKELRTSFPKIQLFCMIRSREGNFCYDEEEFNVMRQDVIALLEAGADGFVFGFLNEYYDLDIVKCKSFVELCAGRPCTLHRAFDVSQDWKKCLDSALEAGFTCILTSGQKPTAEQGLETLENIMNYNKNRLTIMIGSGVNSKNLKLLVDTTNATWYHGSAARIFSAKNSSHISMGSADSDNLKYTCPEETIAMKRILRVL